MLPNHEETKNGNIGLPVKKSITAGKCIQKPDIEKLETLRLKKCFQTMKILKLETSADRPALATAESHRRKPCQSFRAERFALLRFAQTTPHFRARCRLFFIRKALPVFPDRALCATKIRPNDTALPCAVSFVLVFMVGLWYDRDTAGLDFRVRRCKIRKRKSIFRR